MSYIGQGPQFASFPSKFFDGDDSAMTVTLDYAPPNLASLLVFIDGVRQDTSAYTLSGTSLTFTGSVPSGTANVQVVHLGLQVDVGVPGDDTIATAKIQDDAVTSAKIATDAVDSAEIAANAVGNAEMANMAANTIKVRDANSSGDPSDKALANTEILIGDGTGFTAASLSGDATMTNAGAVTIADNAVSLAKMAGLARGKIIYGDSSGDPAALAVGSADQVLTSDGTDVSWVSAASSGFNSVQTFTSSGTWTRPSGITKVWIRVQGAGGGGGGQGSSSDMGGGGGGGGYSEKFIDVSSVSTSTITVGAQGTGGAGASSAGAGNAATGSTGGASSWADGSTTVTGSGGVGGVGASSSNSGNGGDGGAASGGSLNCPGGDGEFGGASLSTGGESMLGNAGVRQNYENWAVEHGKNYGGGGAGGCNSAFNNSYKHGRDAGNGIVIVHEYK